MAILFPTGLDNFTNPTPANNLNTPTVLHSDQHSNLNDAVEALEAKVGINSSLVTGTFDFRINHLESSVQSPGGLNTYIQYNNSGTFGGDAGLKWDKVNQFLAIGDGSSAVIHGHDAVSGFPLGTGFLTIRAGNSIGADQRGGDLALYAGDSSGNNYGGDLLIAAGDAGDNGNGGTVTIEAGGSGFSSGIGGNIVFTIPPPHAGSAGRYLFSYLQRRIELDFSSAPDDSVFSFPNSSGGTIALTSDLHNAVTIGTANGLSLAGQVLSLGLSSTSTTGALSDTDWDTFNGKQNALSFPLSPSLGGTGVNNGTFNLTVPATGTAALLATANVFTVKQTIEIDGAGHNEVLKLWGGTTDVLTGPAIGFYSHYNNGGYPNFKVGEIASTWAYPDKADMTFYVNDGTDLTNGANMLVGLRMVSNPGKIDTYLPNGTLTLKGSQAGLLSILKIENTLDTGINSKKWEFALGEGGVSGYLYLGRQGSITSTEYDIAFGRDAVVVIGPNRVLQTSGANGGFSAAENGYVGVYTNSGNYLGLWGVADSIRFYVDYEERMRVNTGGLVGIGTASPSTNLHIRGNTTTTNAIREVQRLEVIVSTAATGSTNGFGTGQSFYAETATDGTNQQQALIASSWIDATNATRKANLILSAYDTAQRVGLTIAADGTNCTLTNGGKMIGFTPTTGYASFNLPSGVAPSSPVDGDMWNDGTQKVIQHFTNGIKKSISGVIFTQTADKNVNNTVTETTLFGTGVGTLTLPANYFVIGKEVRLRIWGFYSTTGNPNIQFKLKYGSTVLIDSGVFSAGTGIANQLFHIDLRITCRTTGATGTVYSQGYGHLFVAHGISGPFDMETTSTVTIDTTTSNALDVTVTWGTANSGNTITSTNSAVEILN